MGRGYDIAMCTDMCWFAQQVVRCSTDSWGHGWLSKDCSKPNL